MSPLRAATTGATTASASFSSAIGTCNLPIRVRAPANLGCLQAQPQWQLCFPFVYCAGRSASGVPGEHAAGAARAYRAHPFFRALGPYHIHYFFVEIGVTGAACNAARQHVAVAVEA